MRTTPAVFHGAGRHTLTKEGIATRYGVVVVRMMVDPANPQDVQQVHALQDALTVSQQSPGSFEIPNWDEASLKNYTPRFCSLGRRFSIQGECSALRRNRLIRCGTWSEPRWFGAAFLRRTPFSSRSRRLGMTASPSISSRSRTCRSMASGQSPSTAPRVTWSQTHTTSIREQHDGEQGSRRLGHRLVRRLRWQDSQLPVNHEKLVLHGSPDSPATRNPRRRKEIP